MPTPLPLRRVALATASAVAAGAHAAAVPSHLLESSALALAFCVVAVAQLTWAAVALAAPSVTGVRWAVLGNVAVIVAWVMSRTVGLPLVGHAEPVGALDAVATAAEVLFVVVAMAPRRRAVQRALPRAAAATAVAAALAVAPLAAVTTPSLTSHGHAAAAEPHAGTGDHHAGAAVHPEATSPHGAPAREETVAGARRQEPREALAHTKGTKRAKRPADSEGPEHADDGHTH
jgi:hypothetical protein